MTKETAVVEEVEVVETTPESVETAETPTEEATEPEVAEEAKEFTQKDIDDAVGKRLARERRKLEREKNSAPPAPVVEGDPEGEDARIEKRVQEVLKERDQHSVVAKFAEREDDFVETHPDYDDKVTNNQNLPISAPMADVIKASEVGPDLAYHLADNPKEAARISKLPPLLQAKELGRIEATITAVPVKRQSNAPAPITPITPKSGGDQNPGDMSASEYRRHSLKQRRSAGNGR